MNEIKLEKFKVFGLLHQTILFCGIFQGNRKIT